MAPALVIFRSERSGLSVELLSELPGCCRVMLSEARPRLQGSSSLDRDGPGLPVVA